jgi:hypothetical protein
MIACPASDVNQLVSTILTTRDPQNPYPALRIPDRRLSTARNFGLTIAVIALLLLFLLYGGYNWFGWFGEHVTVNVH